MIEHKNIKIDQSLFNFVNTEVLNELNISSEYFWNGFSDIVDIYYKKNNDLLNIRKNLQSKIILTIKYLFSFIIFPISVLYLYD